MKVNIVCGGESSEREVSLRSGNSVANALQISGHDVTILDTDADDTALSRCDVVFPVLHGVGGEDGTFQARLEGLQIPFVGSGSTASKLCMDKDLYRTAIIAAGFTMAEGATLTHAQYLDHPLSTKPHVVKPINGGSSIDTLIVRDSNAKDAAQIEEYFSRYESMIVEELIEGDEVTVAVLMNKALPVIEIIPPNGKEFDFENKYNGSTQELCPPVNISAENQRASQNIASRIHTFTGCRDLSRTDIIITADNVLYVLETNTIPGLTDQSLFPKAAAAAGHTMSQLVDTLVNSAIRRN